MSSPPPASIGPTEANAVHAIRDLVEAKDLRAAKQQLRRLQTAVDDETWAMIVEIANTLRFKTHTVAVTKLRNLWQRNERFRPLIEACVPKSGEHQHIPEPVPRRLDNGPIVPRAGRVSQTVDPDKRVAPHERRRSPNTKIVDDYERALAKDERDDPGVSRPEPIIDRHDYDVDPMTHVSTTLCVSCRLERAAVDHHTERARAGLGDDGLCGECRSLGRPGLPELAPGHSLTDQIHARLTFLADNFHPSDRGIFRQEWRYADRRARPIISAWVRDHTSADPSREPTARNPESTDLNGWCETCGELRQLVPGHSRGSNSARFCIDCEPRYQQPGIRAGSIEATHDLYSEEIDLSQRSAARMRPSPEVALHPSGARESGAPPKAHSTELEGPASKRTAPSLELRKKLIDSAREKTKAAAQERRRAIAREPRAAATRSRTIRH